MDITLKKIDLIRERTGVSYREAKNVLEQAEGNVIEALIQLEDQKKDWKQDIHTWKEEFTVKGTEVADKVKEVLRKGNVHKITIKQDGKKVAEIPVVLGALGGLLLPELAVLGLLGALFKQYTIELEREEPIVATRQEESDATQTEHPGH
jgi:hypothetical protein